MANEKDIKIGIQTTGDVSGAKAVEDAIKSVETTVAEINDAPVVPVDAAVPQSVKEVEAALARVVPVVGEVDKSVKRVEETMRLTGRMSLETFGNFRDKAKVSEFAFYDLDEALGKVKEGLEEMPEGAAEAEESTLDVGRALLTFSQGAEDAQYGVKGILNNIPQLVEQLGGSAGLAGALSLTAVGLSVVYDWLGEVEVSTEGLTARIDAFRSSIGEVEADRFAEVADAITLARESAEALEVQYAQTRRAEGESAVAALDNAAKIRQAQDNIALAMGRQVDAQKQLIALEDAAAAKRALVAQQAIAAEQERLKLAYDEAEKQADILSDTRRRLDDETARLVTLRAQLATRREIQEVLETFAKGEGNYAEGFGPGLEDMDAQAAELLKKPGGFNSYKGRVRDLAQDRLASPDFQAEGAMMQSRLDRLEQLVQTLTNTVPRAENALTAVQLKVEDVERGVLESTSKIKTTLEASQLLGQSEVLLKTAEQMSDDLRDSFGTIKTTNARGLEALASIAAATADGKITLDEMAKASRDQGTLMGLLQSGQATSEKNMQALLSMMTRFDEVQRRQAAQIQTLQQRR